MLSPEPGGILRPGSALRNGARRAGFCPGRPAYRAVVLGRHLRCSRWHDWRASSDAAQAGHHSGRGRVTGRFHQDRLRRLRAFRDPRRRAAHQNGHALHRSRAKAQQGRTIRPAPDRGGRPAAVLGRDAALGNGRRLLPLLDQAMTTVRAWACVTEERYEKAGRLMEAVQDGWPGVATVIGAPPEDGRPFFCWGQMWLTLSLVPRAIKIGRPFWQIDNGPVFPPLNGEGGFHRFCYRSLSMIMLRDAPERSLAAATAENFRPWRSDGRHVLIALPGIGFGQAVGLDMREYYATVLDQVQAVTDRPIKIRPKRTRTPIDKDLTNCWALVTHSSNVAVDAVIRGIPVFVAPTNPAAAVGNLDLADIE